MAFEITAVWSPQRHVSVTAETNLEGSLDQYLLHIRHGGTRSPIEMRVAPFQLISRIPSRLLRCAEISRKAIPKEAYNWTALRIMMIFWPRTFLNDVSWNTSITWWWSQWAEKMAYANSEMRILWLRPPCCSSTPDLEFDAIAAVVQLYTAAVSPKTTTTTTKGLALISCSLRGVQDYTFYS